jgi:hypothetical protein
MEEETLKPILDSIHERLKWLEHNLDLFKGQQGRILYQQQQFNNYMKKVNDNLFLVEDDGV